MITVRGFIDISSLLFNHVSSMKPPEKNKTYWDSVSDSKKTFTHPVPARKLLDLLSPHDRMLDYGCGYGRAVKEMKSAGFSRVIGVDISAKMVTGGRGSDPSLDLLVFDGHTLPFADATFSGCLFMAVLNCIPEERRQRQALSEILRVLKPAGILFISDYPIQEDSRNQDRYLQGREEFGTFGVFLVSGGGVFRHHKMPYIYRLLSGFEMLEESSTEVKTMNGNPARIFQIMARKKTS